MLFYKVIYILIYTYTESLFVLILYYPGAVIRLMEGGRGGRKKGRREGRTEGRVRGGKGRAGQRHTKTQ